MSVQAEESELLAVRRRKLEALREAGIDPFPHAYPDVTPIAEAKGPHEGLEPGEETDVRVRVAGRLHARRGQGKMAFLDLDDRTRPDPAPGAPRRARRRGVRAAARAPTSAT